MAKVDKLKQFRKEFERYQKLLGLTGYMCYFKEEFISDAYADIVIKDDGKVATVRLSNGVPPRDSPRPHVKVHGKHEALHLLLSHIETLARKRYVREDEISEAAEEIVRRLEKVLP